MTDDEARAWVEDLRARRMKPAVGVKTAKSRGKKTVVGADEEAKDDDGV